MMPASLMHQPTEAAKALLATFEQAVDAGVIVGGEHDIRHFNGAAERLWGYDRNEVLGREVVALVPAEMRAHLLDAITAAPTPEALTGRSEFRIARKDGAEAWGA